MSVHILKAFVGTGYYVFIGSKGSEFKCTIWVGILFLGTAVFVSGASHDTFCSTFFWRELWRSGWLSLDGTCLSVIHFNGTLPRSFLRKWYS